jgi:hypothetical protein
VWRKIIFFQFFLLDEWTTYFTSFSGTPSTPNFDSVWARGEVLLKTGIRFIFHVFEELLHIAMWLNLPKEGSKKEVCFAYRILDFHFFFTFFFFLIVLHDVTFNMTATIWIWSFWVFSRNFTRSIVLKFWVKTPVNKRNFSSLKIQIWSWDLSHVCSTWFRSDAQKTQKKEGPLIFINFGVKKITVKNTQKKKTLMFECYNLLDPMEWGAKFFWGWFPTR